jgi:hypothetical protein
MHEEDRMCQPNQQGESQLREAIERELREEAQTHRPGDDGAPMFTDQGAQTFADTVQMFSETAPPREPALR